MRSALIGALATIIASSVLNLVVTAMANRSVPGGVAPQAFAARLYYAWCTLYGAMSALFSHLLGGVGALLATAAAGAALGALIYLLRTGYGRLEKRHHHGKHTTVHRHRRR